MTRPNLQREGLRKAAIFVASLDRHAADLVLEQMDPQMAQIIRQLMVAIDQIDPAEQRRVFDEFRRGGQPAVEAPAPAPAAVLPGVEVEGSLAQQFAKAPQPAPEPDAPRTPPFRFLRDTESDKLTRILMGERPQVIALVLSHLAPQQAGRVLVRLAPAVQTDVLRRLVDLEETDPEILREVEHGLQSRLAEQVRMQRRRVAGLSAITGIIEASDDQVGEAILQNLASRDRGLAQRLSPPPIDFDDLFALRPSDLHGGHRRGRSRTGAPGPGRRAAGMGRAVP